MMVAYLGGNVYIFVRALQQMSGAPMWVRVLFGAIYWLAAVSLFVAMGLRHSALPATMSRTLFGVGSAWMVFTLYMVIALIVCDLAHWAMPSLRGGFWIALGVVSTVLAYGYWNYRHPRVVELDLTIDRPIEDGEMRIVAVSDVHLGEGTGRKALSRYVELINAQKPDAVLIAGDLIDNSVVPVERDSMCEEFEAVEAPIYMAAGNHEYISGLEQVERLLAPTPIHLLRDSIVTLPNGVQLIGRDDRSNRRREPLSALIAKTDTPDRRSRPPTLPLGRGRLARYRPANQRSYTSRTGVATQSADRPSLRTELRLSPLVAGTHLRFEWFVALGSAV